MRILECKWRKLFLKSSLDKTIFTCRIHNLIEFIFGYLKRNKNSKKSKPISDNTKSNQAGDCIQKQLMRTSWKSIEGFLQIVGVYVNVKFLGLYSLFCFQVFFDNFSGYPFWYTHEWQKLKKLVIVLEIFKHCNCVLPFSIAQKLKKLAIVIKK